MNVTTQKHLSFDKRDRAVDIYIKNNLHLTRNRIHNLKVLCEAQDIIVSKRSLISLIKKWQLTGSVHTQV